MNMNLICILRDVEKKHVNFMIWIKSVVVMWLLLTFRSDATQVIVVIMNTGSLFLKKQQMLIQKTITATPVWNKKGKNKKKEKTEKDKPAHNQFLRQ